MAVNARSLAEQMAAAAEIRGRRPDDPRGSLERPLPMGPLDPRPRLEGHGFVVEVRRP